MIKNVFSKREIKMRESHIDVRDHSRILMIVIRRSGKD